MSTKTGLAFSRAMLPAVATNVKGGVMTSSPESTPNAISGSNIASDPEAQPSREARTDEGRDFSLQSLHLRTHDELAGSPGLCPRQSRMSSFMVAYSAFRSRKGKSIGVVTSYGGDLGWIEWCSLHAPASKWSLLPYRLC